MSKDAGTLTTPCCKLLQASSLNHPHTISLVRFSTTSWTSMGSVSSKMLTSSPSSFTRPQRWHSIDNMVRTAQHYCDFLSSQQPKTAILRNFLRLTIVIQVQRLGLKMHR
eukprot:2488316-Amphidinium_carterae.3